MQRLVKLDAPGVLHYVMDLGIERRKIFFELYKKTIYKNALAYLDEGEDIENG